MTTTFPAPARSRSGRRPISTRIELGRGRRLVVQLGRPGSHLHLDGKRRHAHARTRRRQRQLPSARHDLDRHLDTRQMTLKGGLWRTALPSPTLPRLRAREMAGTGLEAVTPSLTKSESQEPPAQRGNACGNLRHQPGTVPKIDVRAENKKARFAGLF